MASMVEGSGYQQTYETDIMFHYNGIYSKFVDKIYFRGKYNLVTEFGISLRGDYIKSSAYNIYRTLDKPYVTGEVESLDMDDKIRKILSEHHSATSITEKDLVVNDRQIKLNQITYKIKERKKLKNRIRKFCKLENF